MAGRYQEQHPIPQNISSYQFRLVGDMTLKQFFQVAGGALVALLIYSTQLVTFIKWPLMFLSFLFGVALAFFPLEDRPLEKWIVLFFKAIYSPTKFNWVKSKHINYFAEEGTPVPQTQAQQQPVQTQPATDSTKTAAPVGMHQEATTAQDELETTEQEFLSSISQQMTGKPVQVPTQTNTSSPAQFPPQTTPQQSNNGSTITTPPTQPTINNQSDTRAADQTEGEENQIAREQEETQPAVEQIQVRTQNPEPTKPESPSDTVSQTDNSNTEKPVQAPERPDTVSSSETHSTTPTTKAPSHESDHSDTTDTGHDTEKPTSTAQFAPDVTAPVTPTRENLVVGQVMDTEDHVLENAILEIRDSDKRPARALKTNKLGHFGIVTPLSEGTYTMTVEKDGYEFDPVTITINNTVLEPIAIRAKKEISDKEV